MIYRVITDKGEAARAFDSFKSTFARDSRIYPEQTVGFQGGYQVRDVYWRGDLGVWGLFEQLAVKGRYWLCFGIDDPSEKKSLPITVEINPPLSGVNRRCAGIFLARGPGETFIGHTGKIGGGRKGIGKAAFREYTSNRKWEVVSVPGGRPIELTIIGQLESGELGKNVASFVNEVAEFKYRIAGGESAGRIRRIDPGSDFPHVGSKRSRAGKYDRLLEYLVKKNNEEEWVAAFDDIERILGFSLPKSASLYPAWWSNGSRMPQSFAWLNAGFRTKSIDVNGKTVRFVRSGSSRGIQEGTPGQHFELSEAGSRVNDRGTEQVVVSSSTRPEQLNTSYSWVELGALKLDQNSKIVFPEVESRPGIYRFRMLRNGRSSIYIGESENLYRRFGHYRNPGPSQATNIRINKILVNAMHDGVLVYVDVIVDTAWISGEAADLSRKVERTLLESAAIIRSDSDQVTMLNR